jgi:hypothetical protein
MQRITMAKPLNGFASYLIPGRSLLHCLEGEGTDLVNERRVAKVVPAICRMAAVQVLPCAECRAQIRVVSPASSPDTNPGWGCWLD